MNRMSRRSFGSTAATSVAALAAMGTVNSAEGQLVYTKSDWKVSEFNEGRFLNNIKNSLNGLHFGFGIPNEQLKIVVAPHGAANM